MRYLDLDIKTINEKLKNREIKPIDLVLESFQRIEETKLNCFITLNKEEAIKKAIELENKEVDNLLFGLPIAIKDNIVTKDYHYVTTCRENSCIRFQFRPADLFITRGRVICRGGILPRVF